ncbi:MAG: hypothetical protein IT441_02995 [Phycisphaeraceae bacterium]|nr:hypothetical protein [Phycisphaeraceae bacterium]
MSQTPDPVSTKVGLQGSSFDLADERTRAEILDKAFDYRGDVTVHTVDGREVEGFVFDRRGDAPDPFVRLIPKDGSARQSIPYRQIRKLTFSGRDTAEGRSWETWVQKYLEKKAKGEHASMDPIEG